MLAYHHRRITLSNNYRSLSAVLPTNLAAHHAAVQGEHHGRAVAEVDGVVVHQEVGLALAQLPELADAVDIVDNYRYIVDR